MSNRPAPSPLQPQPPICTDCREETYWDGAVLWCKRCEATWPDPDTHGYVSGTWDDADAPRCPAIGPKTCRAARRVNSRCIRTAGHTGDHTHGNDRDFYCYCNDWTTPETTQTY